MSGSGEARRVKGRAIALLAGVVLCLGTLELGIRLVGFVSEVAHEVSNRGVLRGQGEYRILCIGESITALGGVDSYPSQLETLLNARIPGRRFKVINKGVMGAETRTLLDELQPNLDRYNPAMVIAMMGLNDFIEIVDIGDQLAARIVRNIPIVKPNPLWDSLKTIKFFRLMHKALLRVREKHRLGAAPDGKTGDSQACVEFAADRIRANQLDQAEEGLARAIALDPNCWEAYEYLGQVYRLRGQDSTAAQAHSLALSLNPTSMRPDDKMLIESAVAQGALDDAELFRILDSLKGKRRAILHLASALEKRADYATAERVLAEGLARDPMNDDLLAAMARCAERQGDRQRALQYFKRAEELRSRGYLPVTVENYHRLYEVLRQNNIQLVCCQYPCRSLELLQRMMAGKTGIVFVDNEALFNDALAHTPFYELFTDDCYGDFGHLTRRGARLLADNIAAALTRECWERIGAKAGPTPAGSP
jgi:tetratricopeptide (TPR) repeat protein